MARFDFEIPDSIFPKCLEENMDEICIEAIGEAQPIVVEEMKKQIKAVISKDGTGELVASIKARKPKKSKYDGYYGKVGPTGYSSKHYYAGKKRKRKYKLSNAAKLVFMEYGTSRQPATPILQKVKKNTENAVINKMQETINRRLEK